MSGIFGFFLHMQYVFCHCLHDIDKSLRTDQIWIQTYLGFIVVILMDKLTLICMRGGIFIALSFLYQILSAQFYQKCPNLYGGKNGHPTD